MLLLLLLSSMYLQYWLAMVCGESLAVVGVEWRSVVPQAENTSYVKKLFYNFDYKKSISCYIFRCFFWCWWQSWARDWRQWFRAETKGIILTALELLLSVNNGFTIFCSRRWVLPASRIDNDRNLCRTFRWCPNRVSTIESHVRRKYRRHRDWPESNESRSGNFEALPTETTRDTLLYFDRRHK